MINQRIMCPNSDIIREKVSTKKYQKKFFFKIALFIENQTQIFQLTKSYDTFTLFHAVAKHTSMYVHKIQVKSHQILQCHSSFESFTSITVHWSITWESFRTTDTSVESIVAETLSVQPNYTNNSPHTAMASGFGLQQ